MDFGSAGARSPDLQSILSEFKSHERHEGHAHEAGDDEGDADAAECGWDVAVAELFADGGDGDDGEEPTEAAAECEDGGLTDVGVAALLHEEGAGHDGAVDGDEGEEDAEGVVERGAELLHDHLDHLDDGGDDGDEHDEAEEGEVHVGQRRRDPRHGAGGEEELVQQVVDGHGDEQHEGDCHAEARGGLHGLGDGKVGAHAEEEGEDHVVDEYRLDEYINVVHSLMG